MSFEVRGLCFDRSGGWEYPHHAQIRANGYICPTPSFPLYPQHHVYQLKLESYHRWCQEVQTGWQPLQDEHVTDG